MLDTAFEGFEVIRGSVARHWIDANGHSRAGLHQFNCMYRAEELYLASTVESMTLHIDPDKPKIEIRNPLFPTE